MKIKKQIPFLLFLVLLSAGCGKPDNNNGKGGGLNDVAKSILDRGWKTSLQGNLEELVQTAGALNVKVGEYCTSDTATPDAAKQKELEAAFLKTYVALKKQSIFMTGPYISKKYYTDKVYLQLRLDDDSVPSRWNDINTILSKQSDIDALKSTKTNGVASGDQYKGLPALYYMIYGKLGAHTINKSSPNYCRLLRKVASIYKDDTETLKLLWWNDKGKDGKPSTSEFQNAIDSGDYTVLQEGKGFYYWMQNPPSDPLKQIGDYKKSLTLFVNMLVHAVDLVQSGHGLQCYNGGSHANCSYGDKEIIKGELEKMKAFKTLVVGDNTGYEYPEGSLCSVVYSEIDQRSGGTQHAKNIADLTNEIISKLTEQDKGSVALANPGFSGIYEKIKGLRFELREILKGFGLDSIKSDADGD